MRERILELIEHVADPRRPWQHLEDLTGIGRHKWVNFHRGKQRATEEMIAKLGQMWPQYAYWLITGITDEKNGHTSPLLERIARDLSRVQKAG